MNARDSDVQNASGVHVTPSANSQALFARRPAAMVTHLMLALALISAALALPPHTKVAAAERKHAIAMHGEPAHPPGFKHFPYVDPNAPKGGPPDAGAPRPV